MDITQSETIHWKSIEQYFTVVLFVFQLNPVCNFGKFISFGLSTFRVNTPPTSNANDTWRNESAELVNQQLKRG